MIQKPSSHNQSWAPQEISAIRTMSEMGMGNKEIANLMGRTRGSVAYQKSVHGIKFKESNFTGLRNSIIPSVKEKVKKTKEPVVQVDPVVTPPLVESTLRNPAKEITRIARQIARENGKRITMAMFFVEDIE